MFFSDPQAWAMYESHLEAVLDRRNAFSGRRYREDPAILGFNLINEPRCETWAVPDCQELLQRWIERAAAAFKSRDSRHLLSVGSEGFFAHEDRVPVAWQE